MESKIKVLICDDNIAVHESLSSYLAAENMECDSVFDGEQAVEQLKKQDYDVLILDVMLPKMFGTYVCKEVRKVSSIPIIMLSARGEEDDRILGLELGADDYIVKPFSPREVVTRLKTILKRVHPQNNKEKTLTAGALTIDLEAYEVYIKGERFELTPKELEILAFLAKNKGKVISREQIMNSVWGYDYCGDTRAVDTQIKRMRQKLPESGWGFDIKAVYGVGYKFEVTS